MIDLILNSNLETLLMYSKILYYLIGAFFIVAIFIGNPKNFLNYLGFTGFLLWFPMFIFPGVYSYSINKQLANHEVFISENQIQLYTKASYTNSLLENGSTVKTLNKAKTLIGTLNCPSKIKHCINGL